MALYATNIWESPGAGRTFEFNFAGGYLQPSHIKVESEDKTTGARTALAFSLLNAYTVMLTADVGSNSRLWVYRQTPVGEPLADFVGGSRFTEANLDIATQQSIFAVAELYDRIALGLGGKGFTAATDHVTTTSLEGQTVFPAPAYGPTDTLQVITNQLRVHPDDVTRTSSNSVTIPAQPAGTGVTVEVTTMLPIAQASASIPTDPSYGQNVGTGYGVYKTTEGAALKFKTLLAGPNVTITPGTDTITIDATAPTVPTVDKPPVTTYLGSATMSLSTPNLRVEYPNIPAGGWNTNIGTCTVDLEVIPNNYFSVNPGAHAPIVCRCNTDIISSHVSGQGAIFGNQVGIGGTEGAPWPQSSQIETWEYPDTPGNRWVFPNTSGGPGSMMADGQRYRFIIETTKWYDGKRYIRYRRYQWDATWACWGMQVDSGSILDHNIASDLTQTGLVLGHVFGSGAGGWSISYSNITVTWGPPSLSNDNRQLLSRAGGSVYGDITMDYGANIRMSTDGADPAAWTRFMPALDGLDGRATCAPSKASGQSLVAALNSNTSNVGYVAISAFPGYANITTGRLGTASVPELRVGYNGLDQMIYKADGVYVGSAIRPLGNEGLYPSVTNIGGAEASFFSGVSNIDMDQTCTFGHISTYLQSGGLSAGQAAVIENTIRPLYCFLSTLISTTKKKGLV